MSDGLVSTLEGARLGGSYDEQWQAVQAVLTMRQDQVAALDILDMN